MTSYESFWPYYLNEHAHVSTKRLHTLGTGLGMLCHFVLLWISRSMWWFPLGFVCGYVCAWYSHFVIEKNRPATFKHPYWSFFADFEQFFLMVLGWMPAELARLAAQGQLAPSPARRLYRVAMQVVVFGYFGLVGACWWHGFLRFANRPFTIM